ncbi:hypothetical protein [Phytoactinopolyspora limicola]|uniref:hypothetical protein n=1 Tax=Phytoactinopolyspora limicola TaxID=2715536 RepID=UPI0014092756|nr:hypothetical protein [Phytoactinopolyspora limicola]
MRPNPAHEALTEMLERAEGLQDDINEALDDAVGIMESGDAWTGPTTAAAFLDDLEDRQRDLPSLAEHLVDDIRSALQSTPAEIPA